MPELYREATSVLSSERDNLPRAKRRGFIKFTGPERRDISIDFSFSFSFSFFLTLARTPLPPPPPLSDSISIVGDRPACTAEYNEGKRNFRRVNYERARKIAISRMLRRLLLRQFLCLSLSYPSAVPSPFILSFFFLFFFHVHTQPRARALVGSSLVMIDSTVIQPFSPQRSRLIST